MGRKAAYAKLSRPRLFSVVPRRRLFRLLDERMQHPVVWVEGPPGAGKTALVASYLESRRYGVLWYQLDPGDSDPSTFFYYLGLTAPSRKTRLPVLSPEYLANLEGFTRRFFREFFSRLTPRTVVVFDNYQEVPESSAIHKLICVALGEIPEDVNVIAISRTSPPAEIAVLQANSDLAALDWNDLQLTIDETRSIMQARAVDNNDNAQALHQLCGGWAAGLTLVLEGARNKDLSIEDIPAGTQESIFRYFADQLLGATSQADQEILLQSAFFPRITAELAERMAGNKEAGRLLDSLYRRRLFTDRRSQSRTRLHPQNSVASAMGFETEHIYEFHALFRAFLLDAAAKRYSRDEYRALAFRAATLLKEHGSQDSAFSLFCTAHAWEDAGQMILSVAPGLLSQGRWQTLRDWIERLPARYLETSPWLNYWLARALIPTDHAQARESFERALHVFEPRADRTGQLMCIAGIIWSHFLEARSTERLKSWMSALDSLLSHDHDFPSADIEVAALSAFLLGAMWLRPDHPGLHRTAVRLLELMDSDVGLNEKVAVGSFVMQYCKNAASVELGARFVDKVDSLAKTADVMPLEKANWLASRGSYFYGIADLDEALKDLRDARALAQTEGLAHVEKRALEFLAYTYVFLGNREEAEQALVSQEKLLRQDMPVALANFYLGRCFLAQLNGQTEEARRFADRAREAAARTTAPFFILAWDAALVGVYAQARDFDRAEAMVVNARRQLAGTCYACYDGLLVLGQAYVEHCRGNVSARNACLHEALTWSKERGTPYFFRWMVAGMPVMFSAAIEAKIETEYVQSLIRSWRVRPPALAAADWPWPFRIHVLGGFKVFRDSLPLRFNRKAPVRLLEFLKLVASRGGDSVSADYIKHCLWSDSEGDAADGAFTNALHRLRKLLGDDEVVLLSDGQVSINDRLCQLDLWAFESLCSEVTELVRSGGPSIEQVAAYVEKLLGLYCGHVLGSEAPIWATEGREKARSAFERSVTVLGSALEHLGDWQTAATLYQRGIEVDGLAEQFYLRLMVCQKSLDQRTQATETYRRLKEMLSIVLGLKPSPETRAVFESLTSTEAR
jgi:LuxR family maltose regulon positive regulatory protein